MSNRHKRRTNYRPPARPPAGVGRVFPKMVDKPIERVTIKVRENVTVDAAGKEHRRPVPMTLARIRFVE